MLMNNLIRQTPMQIQPEEDEDSAEETEGEE